MKHSKKLRIQVKKIIFLLVSAAFLTACQTWGEWDEPAGNQKNPDRTIKLMSSFPFKLDLKEEASDLTAEPVNYADGVVPEIAKDVERGDVLTLSSGYVKIPNPLKDVTADVGASFAFWMKADDLNRVVFSVKDEAGNFLTFKANTEISYSGANNLKINDPAVAATDAVTAGKWHYIGLIFTKSGFSIYIDGAKKYDLTNALSNSNPNFDYTQITDLIKKADFVFFGGETSTITSPLRISKLKIYRNEVSTNEVQPDNDVTQVVDPIYFNNFDPNTDATIQGGGKFVTVPDPGYGTVFQNATGGMRKNYLLLPEHVLSHSAESKEMTIAVWVNASQAGGSSAYSWSPLFTAYGAPPANNTNTWPMFAAQYRGVLQVNCAGWSDFTDAQNVAGFNTLYHFGTDWLADGKWHYYSVVLTATSAKVYFDGVLKNEWKVSGTGGGNEIAGLFSNGADLKHICLGGNQAWNWSDNDPGFMFDDIAIYNVALTGPEIEYVMSQKK